MSLGVITDTLNSKLSKLRSGSESNDDVGSPEFPKNRRHTLGQPLRLYSENIPYADESPERLFHSFINPLDPSARNDYQKHHQQQQQQQQQPPHRLYHYHQLPTSLNRSSVPIMTTTPGRMVVNNKILTNNEFIAAKEKERERENEREKENLSSNVGGNSSVLINKAGSSSGSSSCSSSSGVGGHHLQHPSSAPPITSSLLVSGPNKSTRFSTSIYERCCSEEDDSEGSTTSDPKEALVLTAPTILLDKFNKKRRDHRLFRSASFNCRNYSTRYNSINNNSANNNSNNNNSSLVGTMAMVNSMNSATTVLTKDEKTDMNLTKKRQIQNKQNRSIKRRHTVGGPHDYNNGIAGAGGHGGHNCSGGNRHCKHHYHNHHYHHQHPQQQHYHNHHHNHCKDRSGNNLPTNSNLIQQQRRAIANGGGGPLTATELKSSGGAEVEGNRKGDDGLVAGVSGSVASSAVTNVTTAAGDHVLEVDIRIKNINRGRF